MPGLHHQISKNPSLNRKTIIAEIAPPCFDPLIGRMDLMMTDSEFHTVLADVTITHLNPSPNKSVTHCMMAYREQAQRNKYSQAARIVGEKFFPLVLETMGSMGSSFQSFIKKLQSEFFRNSNEIDPDTEREMRSRFSHLLWTKISRVFQRANARRILSKLNRTQQALQSHHSTATVDFSGVVNWSVSEDEPISGVLAGVMF